MSLAGAGRSTRRFVVIAVLAALVLAGCSSPKQSATPTSGATTSTTADTTTTAPAPATTTTTVPGCTGANYTLSLLGTEGAAGTNEVTFGLRNTSSATCTLFGYPGVLLLGRDGASIATNAVRGGDESFTDFAPANVSVAAGATAYFNIGYSDVVTGQSSCPTTTGIQVIPPDTTTQLSVAAQFTVCNAGTVDVSPVFGAGSSESQTTAPANP